MKINTYLKIKNDPNLQRYIRENSYWYKLLNRNPIGEICLKNKK